MHHFAWKGPRRRLSLAVALLSMAAIGSPASRAAGARESANLSKPIQVTRDFVKAGEGYFAPDGTMIIYQAVPREYPFYQIYTQNLTDASEPRRISTGRGRTTCAYFHPTKSRVIFASSHLDPNLDATEKAEREQQAADKKSGRRRRYRWVFDPHMEIFETDRDGDHPKRLTDSPGYDAECAYSPDGKQIVFCSDRDGDPDLYVINADGSGVRQLTDTPGYDGGPFFSPDGRWIVFRSDRKKEGHLQLYAIGVDGENEVALTDNIGVNWAPYWHPTQPYIVWCGADHSDPKARPNYDLWLMAYREVDGQIVPGKTTRLTNHPSADVLPVFSPDGEQLMWTSTRTEDGSSQLWLADFKAPTSADTQQDAKPNANRDGRESSDAGEDSSGSGTSRQPDTGDEPNGDVETGEDETELSLPDHEQESVQTERRTIDGTFESAAVTEIAVSTETWSDLTVVSAVPHGRRVAKGATLIRLDRQKIDVAIADQEDDIASSRLALRQAETKLKMLNQSVPQKVAAARREDHEAAEDLKRFLEVDRRRSLTHEKQKVTSARHRLAYQEEELRQLKKMYEADDLTEETEEIILTRTRHRVQAAQHKLVQAIAAQEELVTITLPRKLRSLKQASDQAAIASQEASATLPASVTEAQLARDKQQATLRKATRRLARLRRDRNRLTITSPADGVVYYGHATRGQWPALAAASKALRPGSAVTPHQILMTVVRTETLFVRATVDETDLPTLRRGMAVEVIPTAMPDRTLVGRMVRVSNIPVAPGKFDVRIRLEGKLPKRLVAGMTCQATITADDAEDRD